MLQKTMFSTSVNSKREVTSHIVGWTTIPNIVEFLGGKSQHGIGVTDINFHHGLFSSKKHKTYEALTRLNY